MAFKDIIGQEVPKKILISQLRSHRIATSYLFYGPEGIGKTLTAKIFAKAINCEKKEDSCDVCPTCKEIDTLRNPDFKLILPEQSIGIDQIRSIKARHSYKPAWLKNRVTIIKEADKLTEEASNAFLKILEEPPPNTIFILTTSKLSFILPTIRSRCQKIKFRRLKTQEIEKFLHDTGVVSPLVSNGNPCSARKRGKLPLHEILPLANGSISRALKLLSPETQELKNIATEFLLSTPIQRMQVVEKLNSLDHQELLLSIQELYMDFLRKNISTESCEKTPIKSVSQRIKEVLNAMNTCESAYQALSQNVHKKLIFYYLSKELPRIYQNDL